MNATSQPRPTETHRVLPPYATKADFAYTWLREAIISGELIAGDTLNQDSLAKSIGVSTTPLREAVRRLGSEGLVIADPHRDAIVVGLDSGRLESLYEVRGVLDAFAVSLAAKRATPQQREAIAEALALCESASVDDQILYNHRLHAAIYRSCGNADLVEVLDRLWDLSDIYRRSFVAQHPHDKQTAKEHAAIVRHVLVGDSTQAAEQMSRHIARTRSMLAGHVMEGGK